ncbi:hypothetical protein ANTPLA_LOCUS4085 [Anthophora plagiata]
MLVQSRATSAIGRASGVIFFSYSSTTVRFYFDFFFFFFFYETVIVILGILNSRIIVTFLFTLFYFTTMNDYGKGNGNFCLAL